MSASGINACLAKRIMGLPTIFDAVDSIGPDWGCVKHDFSNAFMYSLSVLTKQRFMPLNVLMDVSRRSCIVASVAVPYHLSWNQ